MLKLHHLGQLALFLALAFLLVACGGSAKTKVLSTPTPNTSTDIPGTGPRGLPLYCPQSVVVDSQNNVYISDSDINTAHGRIIKLSPTGQELAEWHIITPQTIGTTQGPGSATFDAQGNMYVIDLGLNKVLKVSPSGKVLTSWGANGTGPGQFEMPEAIAADSQGNVYVGDWDNSSARIEKFTSGGSFLGTLPIQVKPGPMSLSVDSSGNLYIANDISITKINSAGKILDAIQLSENSSSANGMWTGLSLNARGDLYAVYLVQDRFTTKTYPRIEKIDLPAAKTLSVWNLWKSGYVLAPSVAVDSQGNVYAVERTSAGVMQLQKFSANGSVLATLQGTCSSQ